MSAPITVEQLGELLVEKVRTEQVYAKARIYANEINATENAPEKVQRDILEAEAWAIKRAAENSYDDAIALYVKQKADR